MYFRGVRNGRWEPTPDLDVGYVIVITRMRKLGVFKLPGWYFSKSGTFLNMVLL